MVIVAAVDESERATDVIREAGELATAFDETVHVVHVMTQAEFVDLGVTQAEAGDPLDMDEVRSMAAEVAADAAEELDAPYEAVGLMGDPAPRIVDYAADQDARYLVVSGRKRSPAGKALFGSTTQSILINATCPVVTSIRQQDA